MHDQDVDAMGTAFGLMVFFQALMTTSNIGPDRSAFVHGDMEDKSSPSLKGLICHGKPVDI